MHKVLTLDHAHGPTVRRFLVHALNQTDSEKGAIIIMAFVYHALIVQSQYYIENTIVDYSVI